MNLITTVYVSSAVKLFTPAELVDLLRAARERNGKAEITGMLLYHDGNFIQMLEGPASAVDALMVTIRRDPRHTGLIVLLRETIEARVFGEWQMAFRDTRELSSAELSDVGKFLQPALSSGENAERSSAALRLLQIFRDQLR
jgi:hypothetical protein